MTDIVKNLAAKRALVDRLFESEHSGVYAPLTGLVHEIIKKRERFLSLAGSAPCYAFDRENLEQSVRSYSDAFAHIAGHRPFYAVKVNHYRPLLEYVFSHGFGADVSSGRELEIAIEAGAAEILFSGPGKTFDELRRAVDASDRVILNMDSFGELRKLASVLSGNSLRAGVRVSLDSHGSWEKFGIPLEKLSDFFGEASSVKGLDLCGIQIHMSWNPDAAPYRDALESVARYLKNSLPAEFLGRIRFIDFGGGFRPYNSEGYYPEDTPLGGAIQWACDCFDEEPDFTSPFFITEAIPISEYAKGIREAIDANLRPLGRFEYFSEPGRIICNNAMHVVLTIEDVKSDRCVITNGGTNIVGFERFEFDYFPIVNITRPSETEKPCMVYGSLCMPQDFWGRAIYASALEIGDTLVVPYQGALTYANMQPFIKGMAQVYEL